MWVSAGLEEIDADVMHDAGLHQRVSQLESCERLARAWGPSARFSPFEGEHDPDCWKKELPDALRWALAR